MQLGVRRKRQPESAGPVLTVTGALDSRTRSRVLTRMHRLAAQRQGPLVVDVSRMSYFDSVSLTMLLGAERVIERQLDCPVDIRGLDIATSRLTGLDVPVSAG